IKAHQMMGFYFIRMNKLSLNENIEKFIATIFKSLIIKFSLLKKLHENHIFFNYVCLIFIYFLYPFKE
ncbi:hypothetical protein ABTD17_17875, partial [Acinetobacter baumannii]